MKIGTLNYNEQGIHPNDRSISRHTKFFSKDDSAVLQVWLVDNKIKWLK